MAENSRTEISSITKLTRQELLSLLDITDTTLKKYVSKGMTGVSGTGQSQRFILSQAMQWIKEYELQTALKRGQKPEDTDKEALEARKLLAQVVREEYKTALEMETMLTVEDAQREVEAITSQLRAKLLALPAVWGPQITNLNSIPEAVELLNDLVFNLMDELVKGEPDDDEGDEADVTEDIEPDEDE